MTKKNKLVEALEFYCDNDLNEVILEKTINHFEQKDKKPVFAKTIAAKQNAIKQNIITPAKSIDEAISSLAKKNLIIKNDEKFMPINDIIKKAQKIAKAASSLTELRKAVEDFDGCDLKKMATNTVFCDGNAESRIMVIGEAPGNHEDLQGIPFCGDSGKMLDEMFSHINLTRKNLYITNVIFWRPPGNRRPTDEELAICRPFVERHIELVDPKIIILVGATSMSAVLGINDPVTGIRGKIIEFDAKFMNKKLNSLVLFHPSYLMRQSGKKRIAWRDMLFLEKFLQEKL